MAEPKFFMNRWLPLIAAVAIAASLSGAGKKGTAPKAAGAEDYDVNYNIPLWPEGKVPMAKGDGPLDKPFLTVFLPPPGKRNGASVVVAPGGGNIMLMYGVEGMEIAERYNEWGVAAYVLTYRLSPRYDQKARDLDGTRAMQIVRSHAAEWKLDPNKIGFIGFSAGSSLARSVMDASGPGDPSAADPIDRVSSKPDYLGMIYSAGRAAPGESLKDFPPTFLSAAQFDKGNSLGSAQLFSELTRAGAIAELHLYQKGRHGYGTGFGDANFEDWMPRLRHFLQIDGFLPGVKP